MNRAVAWHLDGIDCSTFGNLVIQAIERAPEAYQKNKECHAKHNSIAKPLELVKYAVRIYPWFETKKGKTSLKELQKRSDPYALKELMMFDGTFRFSAEQGGFLPLGESVEKSEWFCKVYAEREEHLIKDAWSKLFAQIDGTVFMPDGSAPKLIHKFEKPHVYFMQRDDNEIIKIGVSIHPEVRKKQIKKSVGADLSLLHIIPSGGYELEAELHERFKSVNVGGEWFKPSADLLQYIDEIKSV